MIDPSQTSTIIDNLTALFTAIGGALTAVAPWAAVAAGVLAYLQGRRNNAALKETDKAVAVNTAITTQTATTVAATARETTDQSGRITQIHTLVNNMNTSGLGREALLSERLATADPSVENREAADNARNAFVSKVDVDKRAQATADATAEAVSVAEAASKKESVQ